MLANPLGFRTLMSVSGQRNMGTLISIGGLMLICAVGVGLLKTLRSYIFTETANRIDQEAKSSILDQLIRLPQGFLIPGPLDKSPSISTNSIACGNSSWVRVCRS